MTCQYITNIIANPLIESIYHIRFVVFKLFIIFIQSFIFYCHINLYAPCLYFGTILLNSFSDNFEMPVGNLLVFSLPY